MSANNNLRLRRAGIRAGFRLIEQHLLLCHIRLLRGDAELLLPGKSVILHENAVVLLQAGSLCLQLCNLLRIFTCKSLKSELLTAETLALGYYGTILFIFKQDHNESIISDIAPIASIAIQSFIGYLCLLRFLLIHSLRWHSLPEPLDALCAAPEPDRLTAIATGGLIWQALCHPAKISASGRFHYPGGDNTARTRCGSRRGSSVCCDFYCRTQTGCC